MLASSVRPQRSRRTGSFFPPDQAANPSATTAAATRSARSGWSGHPHASGSLLRRTPLFRSAWSRRPRPWRSDPAKVLCGLAVGLRRHGSMSSSASPGAVAAQGTARAVRSRRGAHRGSQVEHRLVELPGLPGGHELIAERHGLAHRQRGPCHGTGQDTDAVGVDGGHVVTERKRADRPGGVRPHAGEGAQRRVLVGHDTAVLGHHRGGGPVQVQRPTVVAQTGPQSDDRRRSGGAAGRRGGEGGEEALVVRHDAVHLGLLQHDLGDEDRPRVARLPPGQVAPVFLPPLQQAAPHAAGPIGLERLGLSPRRRRRRDAAAPEPPRSSTPSACAGSSRPLRRAG